MSQPSKQILLNNLGQKAIRDLRRGVNLSYEEIAQQIGTSVSTVQKIAIQGRYPRQLIFNKLLKLYYQTFWGADRSAEAASFIECQGKPKLTIISNDNAVQEKDDNKNNIRKKIKIIK